MRFAGRSGASRSDARRGATGGFAGGVVALLVLYANWLVYLFYGLILLLPVSALLGSLVGVLVGRLQRRGQPIGPVKAALAAGAVLAATGALIDWFLLRPSTRASAGWFWSTLGAGVGVGAGLRVGWQARRAN
jgi:hypothetical protein